MSYVAPGVPVEFHDHGRLADPHGGCMMSEGNPIESPSSGEGVELDLYFVLRLCSECA